MYIRALRTDSRPLQCVCIYVYIYMYTYIYITAMCVYICVFIRVHPMAFGVSFLHSQISIHDLVLQVSFTTFRWKETEEIEMGDWDWVVIANARGCISILVHTCMCKFEHYFAHIHVRTHPHHKHTTCPAAMQQTYTYPKHVRLSRAAIIWPLMRVQGGVES